LKHDRLRQVGDAKKRYIQFREMKVRKEGRNSREESANRISNTEVIESVLHKHWFIGLFWYLRRRTEIKQGHNKNSLGRIKTSPPNIRKTF
jgi:hypothetical protein